MGKKEKKPYFKGFILWEEEVKQKKMRIRNHCERGNEF